MKIRNLSHKFKAVILTLLFLTGFTGVSMADPVSDAEAVPATAAQMQFINRVIDQVKAAVPPLEGWERNLSSYLADDQGGFRQGEELKLFEFVRNAPLKLTFNIKFHRNTAAEKKQAVEEKSTQELEKEMMAAINIGDMEKVQQLQLKQASMLQKTDGDGSVWSGRQGRTGFTGAQGKGCRILCHRGRERRW